MAMAVVVASAEVSRAGSSYEEEMAAERTDYVEVAELVEVQKVRL